MKRSIISLTLVIISFTAWGQDIFTPVLQQIEQNSTTLQALQQQMEADKLQNKTGLTPDNPEVEFGYLWGKLATLQNNSVEYRYRTERMQLLLTAKELCIELIYNNMMHKMHTLQFENAKKIAAAYNVMMEKGETNRQVKVSQAEGLPKIAVGYMGEFVGNENFQGISVGITIPLWQNKNRVKYARAAALYRSSLDKNNSGEILLKAFEKGELPLLEYLL